jgi:hypothetical protein
LTPLLVAGELVRSNAFALIEGKAMRKIAILPAALIMQVAFVLPLSMPLLVPVGMYRLTWFYPGMMVLLGAHYLPFAFLYGMRMFLVLAALLTGGGLMIAMYWASSFSIGAWYTGLTLLTFAAVGRAIAEHEYRSVSAQRNKDSYAPERSGACI